MDLTGHPLNNGLMPAGDRTDGIPTEVSTRLELLSSIPTIGGGLESTRTYRTLNSLISTLRRVALLGRWCQSDFYFVLE